MILPHTVATNLEAHKCMEISLYAVAWNKEVQMSMKIFGELIHRAQNPNLNLQTPF